VSAAERAAAEKEAERAAAALLAEEEAEEAQKQQAHKKKASKKAKAKQGAGGEAPTPQPVANSSADDEVAAADTEVAAEDASPSVAADEALRQAMAASQYEELARALEEHCALASEGMLVEARAMRERLHKRRKKESQKVRRLHAVEMQVKAGISSLGLSDATAQLPPVAAAEPPPAAAAAESPPAAVALTLGELAAATGGFAKQKLIGSGGYGHVFMAHALPSLPAEAVPSRLRHLPVAVKRAKSGAHDLADLQREVSVLKQCDHPHLLPLLGYYLELESPCLVFPLMRGGSFADRLWPSEADPEHLRCLGLGASLVPLEWRERVRILRQATDALLYLHTPVPGGKGAVVHRDFKPENILLDDDLNAYLADTGFAKMDSGPEQSKKQKSASNALYLTRGYLDPSVTAGGEYSAATDGWALGITMLVALTGRSPLNIIDECEEAFDEDFADIDAGRLADSALGWPPLVATTIKDLVRSGTRKCLCHPSNRKKLAVADALASLTKLMVTGGGGEGAAEDAAVASSAQSAPTTVAAAARYAPTALSMQVRETRKGLDAAKGIKQNMLLAFDNLMPRLDAVYASRAAEAPDGFDERLQFWHRTCGMRADLTGWMHSLRIWANAARHHDDARWQRDGPSDEAEASRLVSAARTAIEALERVGAG